MVLDGDLDGDLDGILDEGLDGGLDGGPDLGPDLGVACVDQVLLVLLCGMVLLETLVALQMRMACN